MTARNFKSTQVMALHQIDVPRITWALYTNTRVSELDSSHETAEPPVAFRATSVPDVAPCAVCVDEDAPAHHGAVRPLAFVAGARREGVGALAVAAAQRPAAREAVAVEERHLRGAVAPPRFRLWGHVQTPHPRTRAPQPP